MSSITLSNLIASSAAYNLRQTNSRLGESILRLSSGLRIQKPSDGVSEFMRASSLESKTRVYEDIRRNLSEYKSILNIANDAAAEINTKIDSMIELSTAATSAALTDAERTAMGVEFNGLRTSIDNIVKGTTYNDGNILTVLGKYNLATTINLTPDMAVTMAMDLNEMDLGATGLDITAVDWSGAGGVAAATASLAEMNTASSWNDSFISEVSGYLTQIASQINVTDSIIENQEAARSALIETDIADEMITYTALDVKKQAATAMLAQANISQRSILQLYQMSFA